MIITYSPSHVMGNDFLINISFRASLYYLWRYLGKCVVFSVHMFVDLDLEFDL